MLAGASCDTSLKDLKSGKRVVECATVGTAPLHIQQHTKLHNENAVQAAGKAFRVASLEIRDGWPCDGSESEDRTNKPSALFWL
jgi:hypothetical protein